MAGDRSTISGFGREWRVFDQRQLRRDVLRKMFEPYFATFPWEALSADSRGVDVGCGSGRWAAFVAERCGSLVCLDPSDAIRVARENLSQFPNCVTVQASAGELPLRDESFDFGYCIGVLHHTPNPRLALADCVSKLRPGAPFLVYVYYALDNRPLVYRTLWRVSDALRRRVSKLPFPSRYRVTQIVAAAIYWPLARTARILAAVGWDIDAFPLAVYRDKPYYVMRNDALDRFGTRLEHRFTKAEVQTLMRYAGLTNVKISDQPPYWCAVGMRP